MSVLGIVAEYNPFHNGHKYHLDISREMTGADAVVCVMSGDFVQRGEPAVYDKWTRTEMALRSGADLVIEIPTFFCLGDASVYARASVQLLEALGCVTHISFGSESGDISLLKGLADLLVDQSGDITRLSDVYAKEGSSWPRARQKAFEELFHDDPLYENYLKCLKGPNNVLALEYLKNIKNLEPITLRRAGAGYGDPYDEKCTFQSATGIRALLWEKEDITGLVPPDVAGIIRHETSTSRFSLIEEDSRLYDLIRYKIITASSETMIDAPQGGEGLENRLKKAVYDCSYIEDLIVKTKSRRYTYTRIARLVLQILLDINRNDFPNAEPQYLRVLGFTDRGRKLMGRVKRNKLNSLPLLTNINRGIPKDNIEFKRLLDLDVKASDVYNLVAGNSLYRSSDHVKKPVMIR